MKYLRRFYESFNVYNPEWQKTLPDTLTVIKGYDDKVYKHTYKKGNILLNSDMIQINYFNGVWGFPSEVQIDIYIVKDSETNNLRLDVDISYGNEITCEFSIDKDNGVRVIQHTTYHSKFDPSNTVFAFDKQSLNSIIDLLNKFDTGIKVTGYDLRFLDPYDNFEK